MDVLVPIKLPKVLRVSTPIHNGSNTFRDDSARTGGRRPRWGADGLSETPPLRHQELRAVSDTSTTRGPSVTRTEARALLPARRRLPLAPRTGLEGAVVAVVVVGHPADDRAGAEDDPTVHDGPHGG